MASNAILVRLILPSKPLPHMSVKTDLAHTKLSVVGADEVNAAFDKAKKKAVEAMGGFTPRKKKAKATSDDGKRKTKHKKLAELASAAGTGVSEKQGGLQRAAVGHGADHQATSERDLSDIFDPEVDGVLV